MTTGLIGRKLGMTRVFDEDGTVVPVTVIEAGPAAWCRCGEARRAARLRAARSRAARRRRSSGHAKKAGLEAAPRVLRVFPVTGDAPTPGAR